MATEGRSLTLDEVAARLGVSRRTVEREIAAGRIRAQRPSPRRVVVSEEEVERVRRLRRDGER